ncbi:MAG: BPSS1780 family membrane protein [Betaproteobacteria bacterium]
MNEPAREFPYTRHPARQGMVWLTQAWQMFKQQRLAWVVLLLAYYLLLLVTRSIPFIGPWAMTIVKPVLAVGLLAAAWHQERGKPPALRLILQGFRANLWALLPIGIFFVLGMTASVFASSIVDGGKLIEFISNSANATEADIASALADPQLQFGMLFAALLSLPVLVSTWWAPALIVFQDAGPGAALLASLRAAFANWRPLVIYGLGVFFYGVVVPGLAVSAMALILPPPMGQVVVLAVLLPYLMFFAATLHISDYVSYRDVFHADETLVPPTPAQ